MLIQVVQLVAYISLSKCSDSINHTEINSKDQAEYSNSLFSPLFIPHASSTTPLDTLFDLDAFLNAEELLELKKKKKNAENMNPILNTTTSIFPLLSRPTSNINKNKSPSKGSEQQVRKTRGPSKRKKDAMIPQRDHSAVVGRRAVLPMPTNYQVEKMYVFSTFPLVPYMLRFSLDFDIKGVKEVSDECGIFSMPLSFEEYSSARANSISAYISEAQGSKHLRFMDCSKIEKNEFSLAFNKTAANFETIVLYFLYLSTIEQLQFFVDHFLKPKNIKKLILKYVAISPLIKYEFLESFKESSLEWLEISLSNINFIDLAYALEYLPPTIKIIDFSWNSEMNRNSLTYVKEKITSLPHLRHLDRVVLKSPTIPAVPLLPPIFRLYHLYDGLIDQPMSLIDYLSIGKFKKSLKIESYLTSFEIWDFSFISDTQLWHSIADLILSNENLMTCAREKRNIKLRYAKNIPETTKMIKVFALMKSLVSIDTFGATLGAISISVS